MYWGTWLSPFFHLFGRELDFIARFDGFDHGGILRPDYGHAAIHSGPLGPAMLDGIFRP
jgi:hypothetical protein